MVEAKSILALKQNARDPSSELLCKHFAVVVVAVACKMCAISDSIYRSFNIHFRLFSLFFFSIISILQIILKTLVFSKLSIVSNVINLMLSARVEYIKAFRKRHTLALVAIEKKNKRPNHQWRSYSLTKPSKPSNGFCILKCDWNGNANAPRHSGFRYSDCVLRLLTTFYMHF